MESYLESVAMMLLGEMGQQDPSSRQYLDSLANILALNLLRCHATKKSDLPISFDLDMG